MKGLRKNYKNFSVLKGVALFVGKGEVFGFIGKNGCGKSTTMNIITGLLAKDAGSVRIGGEKVVAAGRVQVGYLPEAPALFEYMNCRQYLNYIGAACRYSGDLYRRCGLGILADNCNHPCRRRSPLFPDCCGI